MIETLTKPKAQASFEDCSVCGEKASPLKSRCSTCDAHIGYPNVKAAIQSSEEIALTSRYKSAFISAKAGSYTEKLKSFCEEVQKSKAVACMWLSQFDTLIAKSTILLPTFYKQISAGNRVADNDDDWEMLRRKVDPELFPYYEEEIHFAALSLDGFGVSLFGDCHVTLKEKLIFARTTAFEENSGTFYIKHNSKIPPGYRACWENRHFLAAAKYHSMIVERDVEEFPTVLISRPETPDSDFIELHIYGNINRATFEHVQFSQKRCKHERARIEISKNNLTDLGISFG